MEHERSMDAGPRGTLADGVPLYVRVAMSIRGAIARGDYPVGSLLPRFEILAERHGVGLNTIRRAIQVLSSEGIVFAARGQGTRIRSSSNLAPPQQLRSSISDPLELSPDVSMALLDVETVETLPEVLREHYRQPAAFLRVHKLHSFQGTPFGLFDIYVDKRFADQFPEDAIKTKKLSWLLRQCADAEIDTSREELTIAHSDSETAALLEYPVAAPVAKLRRWHLDADGTVLYACIALYRGDTFVWDTTRHATDSSHLSDQLIPAVRGDRI